MTTELLQVADDEGKLLDAYVSLRPSTGEFASITFESQGGGRNKDYIRAHNLIVSRLAAMSAVLVDAIVVSSDTRSLDEVERRFFMKGRPYPQPLSPSMDAVAAARMLRRGAAEVGRREGATGPGNRAKRVELRFAADSLNSRPHIWLKEQLVAPSGALDVDAVLRVSRPRRVRQGLIYMQDAAARKAVEIRAMQVACDHLRTEWDHVVDVSSTESYDLLCRSGDAELHVEVKGTTSDGTSVVVTRNEVQHARCQYPRIALFVISRIDLRLSGGAPVAAGGVLMRYEPWVIDDFDLLPLSFQCCLSTSAAKKVKASGGTPL